MNRQECWDYLGHLSGGYGEFYLDGKNKKAHRIMYEAATGYKLLPFEHVHHKCENKACINPDHLQPLSPEEHRKAHAKDTCGRGHKYTFTKSGKKVCNPCGFEHEKQYRKNVYAKLVKEGLIDKVFAIINKRKIGD